MTELRRLTVGIVLLLPIVLAGYNPRSTPDSAMMTESTITDLSPVRFSRVQTSSVGGTLSCGNDDLIALRCDWDDNTGGPVSARHFNAWLWAPHGSQAQASVPGESRSMMDGLDLQTGYLLMQGLSGTRPRSKSGGGRATGNGTTIIMFSGTRNGSPYYRAACIAGTTQVDFLRRRRARNSFEDLSGQIVKGGFYIEWDKDRVTETSSTHGQPQAVLHRIDSDPAFASNVRRLLTRARVTPG